MVKPIFSLLQSVVGGQNVHHQRVSEPLLFSNIICPYHHMDSMISAGTFTASDIQIFVISYSQTIRILFYHSREGFFCKRLFNIIPAPSEIYRAELFCCGGCIFFKIDIACGFIELHHVMEKPVRRIPERQFRTVPQFISFFLFFPFDTGKRSVEKIVFLI